MSEGNDHWKDIQLTEIAKLIKNGSTPREISQIFPQIFIQEGEGIILLYETINSCEWRGRK